MLKIPVLLESNMEISFLQTSLKFYLFMWTFEIFLFTISRSLSKNKGEVIKMNNFPQATVTLSIEPRNGDII
jgi:hypothetical protein